MKDMYNISIPLRTLRHEEMRWGYMSDKDLVRRLDKITKPEKLSAFYQAALNRGKSTLCEKAYDRFQKLFNGDYKKPFEDSPIAAAVKEKITPIVKPASKPIVKEETISITMKRYIDF